MPKIPKPPAKAACLACRSSKTRCDGQNPCRNCSTKGRTCSYQPSRRGGPRRGIRYVEAQRNRSSDSYADPGPTPEMHETIDPYLEDMMSLVSPFAGIHNLDLSPDALSESSGAHQLWGQLTPSDDPLASAPSVDTNLPGIRSYTCEEEIVNAYYIYFHAFFPLLPPSTSPRQKDQPVFVKPSTESANLNKADLPYWPKSSLSLALSALLVLIPHRQDPCPMTESSILFRRSYAQLFAQAALSNAEKETDDIRPINHVDATGVTPRSSSLHTHVPSQLDPILSLVVLAIYEYCQRGNVSRMRARVNQAVTTAMDISLHDLGTTKTEYSEAQRRAWWMTMFVSYQSSNLHLAAPIVAADDPRITTPFPKFNVHLEPWQFIVDAQKAVFASHIMAQKIERVAETPPALDLRDQIKSLDSLIVSLTTESDRRLRSTFGHGDEASTAENMWRMGRILIYTARIRLHRFRAFMDIPLFLDTYCDLVSINTHGISYPPTPSIGWAADRESAFPFSEQESSNICLKSALAVATAYKNLPYPVPSTPDPSEEPTLSGRSMVAFTNKARRFPRSLPYFACSAMQSSYSLLMLLHKVRACLETDRLATCYHLLNKPDPATEIADAERLIEELRYGVEFLGVPLKSDVIFEGVGGMGREIESAYLAAFTDCTEI